MHPDSLLGLWRYINPSVTYLLTYLRANKFTVFQVYREDWLIEHIGPVNKTYLSAADMVWRRRM